MKEISMIVQTTNLPATQAIQPDVRAHGAAPARPAAVPVAASPPVSPSPAELQQAVATLNQAIQHYNHAIEFSVDSDSERTVVRLVDTSTGELIRQFPSEETLAISRGIAEFQQGLLLRQKA
jgi:flagellar protein FlaG